MPQSQMSEQLIVVHSAHWVLLLQAEGEEEDMLDDALRVLLELLQDRGVDGALRDIDEQPPLRPSCQHSVVSAGVGDVLLDVPALHLLDHARRAHLEDLGDVLGVVLQVLQEGLLLRLQLGGLELLVDLAKSLISRMRRVLRIPNHERGKAKPLAAGARASQWLQGGKGMLPRMCQWHASTE